MSKNTGKGCCIDEIETHDNRQLPLRIGGDSGRSGLFHQRTHSHSDAGAQYRNVRFCVRFSDGHRQGNGQQAALERHAACHRRKRQALGDRFAGGRFYAAACFGRQWNGAEKADAAPDLIPQ